MHTPDHPHPDPSDPSEPRPGRSVFETAPPTTAVPTVPRGPQAHVPAGSRPPDSAERKRRAFVAGASLAICGLLGAGFGFAMSNDRAGSTPDETVEESTSGGETLAETSATNVEGAAEPTDATETATATPEPDPQPTPQPEPTPEEPTPEPEPEPEPDPGPDPVPWPWPDDLVPVPTTVGPFPVPEIDDIAPLPLPDPPGPGPWVIEPVLIPRS